jgi:mannose-6-phosphate isomerase-like protein (cupin superfamily)
MSDVVVKRVEELEYYQGPGAIDGIRFCQAAKSLGVTAWGMNILDLAPRCADYPEHDHARDGQEEVYVVLRGKGALRAGSEEWPIEAGQLIRVGPLQRRKFLAGTEGLTLLALGATPGQAYKPRR